MNKKSAQEKPRVSGGWLEARAGFEPACDFSKGLQSPTLKENRTFSDPPDVVAQREETTYREARIWLFLGAEHRWVHILAFPPCCGAIDVLSV